LCFAFNLQIAVNELGVDAQNGFEQPDVFVPGSEEAFDASVDTDAGFGQWINWNLPAGEESDRIFRLAGNRTNLRQTRWRESWNNI